MNVYGGLLRLGDQGNQPSRGAGPGGALGGGGRYAAGLQVSFKCAQAWGLAGRNSELLGGGDGLGADVAEGIRNTCLHNSSFRLRHQC